MTSQTPQAFNKPAQGNALGMYRILEQSPVRAKTNIRPYRAMNLGTLALTQGVALGWPV